MMKKVSALFLILVTTCTIAAAQQAPSKADLKAMEAIMHLAQGGFVMVFDTEPNGSMFVEPLFWNKLTHIQKSVILQQGLIFFQNLNNLKKKNIEWVGVFDMTSRDTLGSINLENRTISVKK